MALLFTIRAKKTYFLDSVVFIIAANIGFVLFRKLPFEGKWRERRIYRVYDVPQEASKSTTRVSFHLIRLGNGHFGLAAVYCEQLDGQRGIHLLLFLR